MSNPPACLAVDYGSTISIGAIDHLIGQKPVDAEAATALRALHERWMRIILASNASAVIAAFDLDAAARLAVAA